MSKSVLLCAIPELPVDDLAKSIEFYTERMGFDLAFQWDPIAGVQRGPVAVVEDRQRQDFVVGSAPAGRWAPRWTGADR